MRGLTFEIPNKYGKYLFDFKQYVWKTGGEEAYYIEDNKLGTLLFPKPYVYTGEALHKTISQKTYYTIFKDLKAFIDLKHVVEITTYAEFLDSPCEFVLLLVNCSYVIVYAKSEEILTAVYKKAIAMKFENVTYITEEIDNRTTLVAF